MGPSSFFLGIWIERYRVSQAVRLRCREWNWNDAYKEWLRGRVGKVILSWNNEETEDEAKKRYSKWRNRPVRIKSTHIMLGTVHVWDWESCQSWGCFVVRGPAMKLLFLVAHQILSYWPTCILKGTPPLTLLFWTTFNEDLPFRTRYRTVQKPCSSL